MLQLYWGLASVKGDGGWGSTYIYTDQQSNWPLSGSTRTRLQRLTVTKQTTVDRMLQSMYGDDGVGYKLTKYKTNNKQTQTRHSASFRLVSKLFSQHYYFIISFLFRVLSSASASLWCIVGRDRVCTTQLALLPLRVQRHTQRGQGHPRRVQ